MTHGPAMDRRRHSRSGEGFPSTERPQGYAEAPRGPSRSRSTTRHRSVSGERRVECHRAAAKFQQLKGQPRVHPWMKHCAACLLPMARCRRRGARVLEAADRPAVSAVSRRGTQRAHARRPRRRRDVMREADADRASPSSIRLKPARSGSPKTLRSLRPADAGLAARRVLRSDWAAARGGCWSRPMRGFSTRSCGVPRRRRPAGGRDRRRWPGGCAQSPVRARGSSRSVRRLHHRSASRTSPASSCERWGESQTALPEVFNLSALILRASIRIRASSIVWAGRARSGPQRTTEESLPVVVHRSCGYSTMGRALDFSIPGPA